MKKILILFLVLPVLFATHNKVFAQDENILSGKPFDIYNDRGVLKGKTYALTDNNTKTYVDIINSMYYTTVLDKTYDMTGYQMVTNNRTALGYFRVHFYSDVNLENLIGSIWPSSNITPINMKNVRAIKIQPTTNSGGYSLQEVMIFASPRIINHQELENLSLNAEYNQVKLTWTIPIDNLDFVATKIYRNGVLIKTVDSPIKEYIDSSIKPNENYTYKISALYTDRFETTGISQSIKTKAIEEIRSLNAVAGKGRVNLSWKLPEQENLSHVNIYRETLTKKTSKIENFIFGSFVYAAGTKIFETNGTYFNDLTVKPSTAYEYTLTVQTSDDKESNGISARVTTPEDLFPEIDGGGYEKDENGDFLFTWTSPTTGKVRVLIDGKEYKIVEALLKQILIPKEDMKYDIFNNPKVTLVPISEDGTEGIPTKPGENGGIGGIGGGKIPFGPTDLLKSIMGLIGVIAPILLLSLAIIFFKPIKNVIVKAVQYNRERKMYR